MRRIESVLGLMALATCLALLMSGCSGTDSASGSSESPSGDTSESATETATGDLSYGPTYDVQAVSDPLVVATLQGVETTGSPTSGAEIRGYLVDWVISEEASATIREFVVMKDGSLFRFRRYMRPAAAFGAVPPERLTPEPVAESQAREAAMAHAHDIVSEVYPQFASVEPVVFNYLVRIHKTDGSLVDVWVDPDVGRGRFFEVELIPAEY